MLSRQFVFALHELFYHFRRFFIIYIPLGDASTTARNMAITMGFGMIPVWYVIKTMMTSFSS